MSTHSYYPRLSNGDKVPLSWLVQMSRQINQLIWPLEDNAPRWLHVLDRIYMIFGFMLFVSHIESDFRYLRLYYENLDDFLTGVPTVLVSIEMHLRTFQWAVTKSKTKKLLKCFFAEFYLEQSLYPQEYKKIQRQSTPIFIQSTFYIFTLILYTFIYPIQLLYLGNRELVYKTVPPIEIKHNFPLYLSFLLMNCWITFIVATTDIAEANIFAMLIYHLNARYTLMRQNFHNKIEKILKMDSSSSQANIIDLYRCELLRTLQENIKLNKFAKDIHSMFTFRLFITYIFSAITLCALLFKVYTSPMTSIDYMLWTVAKIQEIIALGEVGTTITATTDEISSMYYESKWESIIERSSDSKKNVKLMKLITLAITTNRKPFYVTGLNFVHISLSAALTILNAAFSYFSCLTAVR